MKKIILRENGVHVGFAFGETSPYEKVLLNQELFHNLEALSRANPELTIDIPNVVTFSKYNPVAILENWNVPEEIFHLEEE